MKAAILREYGVPEFGQWEDEPVPGPGQAVVEGGAAGLNPVDVAISGGRFYGGKPPLPSIPGREGVGTLDDGGRVYFDSRGSPFGSMRGTRDGRTEARCRRLQHLAREGEGSGAGAR